MTKVLEDMKLAVDGQWKITWRPQMSRPLTGTLTLDTSGGALAVKMDTDLGTGTCEGKIQGNKLCWTITLGESPSPLTFTAIIEGDEISGEVEAGLVLFGSSSLEGTRVGSNTEVRSREGSDAVAEALIHCGIEYVFGYQGGMSSSLHRSILSHNIPNLAGRTELSAAWISYGYNRVKRRAASGVLVWCVGAMHASPVVYAAKLDSTPLLFMTMESATAWDNRDILQDATDLSTVLRPISKYIKRVVDGEDLPVAVRQAVLAASTGKFGAAVLNFTHNTMFQRTSVKSEKLVLPSPPSASQQDLNKALEMIRQAKNPVLLAGAGVHLANAAAELRKFAEATGIPVVSSGPTGRGVLPDDHPLYAGDMGVWGGFPTGTKVAEQADLWIAIGFGFSQTSTASWSFNKPEKVIHVDVEQSQIGRIFQPTLGIVADARVFLGQLNAGIKESGLKAPDYRNSPRIAEIQKAKEAYFRRLRENLDADPISPRAIGHLLSQEAPKDTLLVGDEGFIVPGAFFGASKYPSGFATPLGFHYASLGSTLPVAIGAKLADPERLVISWGGDGGFFYDCSDLSFLAEHNLKVIVVINNNGGLFGGRRGRASIPGGMDASWLDQPDSDFSAIANGFGVRGERVLKFNELVPAIRRAIAADGPYLLDVHTGASGLIGMTEAMAAGVMPKKFGHGDRRVEGSWPS